MILSRSLSLLVGVPLALTALSARLATATTTPFAVHWTAPGDDHLTGRATSYDLRYSSAPLTAANFALATRVAGLPAPAVAGTGETFVVSGLSDSLTLYLAIKTADESGNWSALSNIALRPGQTTDSDESPLVLAFSLPWPNPARQSVRWSFAMPRTERVRVDVYDVTGRHVRAVTDGAREAGRGELAWNLHDDQGRRVDAGLYLVKARIGTTEWTRRVVVVR